MSNATSPPVQATSLATGRATPADPEDYCAVYRPSLTDSRLRSKAPALESEFDLVPVSWPKKRDWVTDVCTKDMSASKEIYARLYLRHQLYDQSKHFLKYSSTKLNKTTNEIEPVKVELPRLGIQVTVRNIDSVDPSSLTWTGVVRIKLIFQPESLGLDSNVGKNVVVKVFHERQSIGDPDFTYKSETGSGGEVFVLEQHYGRSREKITYENGDAFAFLEACFGLRFQNLCHGGKIEGPKKASDLDFSPVRDGATRFAEGEGGIVGEWSLTGSFRANAAYLNLKHFPFDIGCYDVIISLIGWSPGIVLEHSVLRSFAEFHVMGLSGSHLSSKKDRWNPHFCEQGIIPNSARRAESIAYVRFHARRVPNSMILNFLLPMFLITLLGVVAMYNEDEDFLQNLLLAVVLLRADVAGALPKGLGYVTLFDWYFFACVALICLSILVLGFLPDDCIDSWILPTSYGVAFLTGNMGFAYRAYHTQRIPVQEKPNDEKKTEKLFGNPLDPQKWRYEYPFDENLEVGRVQPGLANTVHTRAHYLELVKK